jgi:hypothetical protein
MRALGRVVPAEDCCVALGGSSECPKRSASEPWCGGNSLNGLGSAARLQRAMAAADRAEALPPILRVRDLGAGFDEDGELGFHAAACVVAAFRLFKL